MQKALSFLSYIRLFCGEYDLLEECKPESQEKFKRVIHSSRLIIYRTTTDGGWGADDTQQ